MVSESRGLTLEESYRIWQTTYRKGDAFLFHEFTGMLLVIKFDGDCALVVTLYKPDCFKQRMTA